MTVIDPDTVVAIRLSDLHTLPASPARNRLVAISTMRAEKAAERREQRHRAKLAAEAARRAELETWAAAQRVRAEAYRLELAAQHTYQRMADDYTARIRTSLEEQTA